MHVFNGKTAVARGFTRSDREGQRIATRMARRDIDTVPRPAGMPDSLKGAGDYRTMWLYRPLPAALSVRVRTLIIDQEDEEYGRRENAGLAEINAIPSTTMVEYHVSPGTHYDIYDRNYRQSAQMARNWFFQHLKQVTPNVVQSRRAELLRPNFSPTTHHRFHPLHRNRAVRLYCQTNLPCHAGKPAHPVSEAATTSADPMSGRGRDQFRGISTTAKRSTIVHHPCTLRFGLVSTMK